MVISNFTKIIRPGRRQHFIRTYCGEPAYEPRSTFVKINYAKGRLSITGVEGPKANGDCFGSCGQINPVELDELAPGWTQDMVDKLNTIWADWHLNDMRPYTADMKAAGWHERAKLPMLVYTFRLTPAASKAATKAKEAAVAALVAGQPFTPTPEQALFAGLPYERKIAVHATEPEPPAPLHYERSRYYSSEGGGIKPPERKTLGWLTPAEHPDGLLGATLNGEGYGTRWWTEEVPADVLTWLQSLPDTDITPAWI